MTVTLDSTFERSATVQRSSVRLEIQALRAVAVLGVLLFHLWPHRLPGGYIGVDVFFVVSGFLITDHLLRESQRTGRIRLPAFWARRARRLLPASLLVLLTTLLAVWLWVPEQRWAQFGGEIIASALYVENWALAGQSVDYMALSNVKSPVQHFWSLGVEEQFYLVWPLLVLLGVVIARSRRAGGIAVVIGAVTLGSLVYSIVFTTLSPSVAYFSTFTRAWEFGAGALLALALRRVPVPFSPRYGSLASWAGFAAIATSMLLFTGATPFPSFTAILPVAGTVLVIAAGSPRTRFAPTPLFATRPVQFVGDVSYGTYLWHWPLIVLLPYALGAPTGTALAVGVLVASIGLGWLSKRFVEDPTRRWGPFARAKPRWTMIATAGAMAVVTLLAVPLATHQITPPSIVDAARDDTPCLGARAMTSSGCGDPESISLVASLASFTIDLPPADIQACERSKNSGEYVRCDFGDPTSMGPHVAVIGDSHAVRMVEPLHTLVEAEGGVLSTFLVSGCPVASDQLTGSAWGYDEPDAALCRDLTVDIYDEVSADAEIETVILMNRTRLYVSDDAAVHPLLDTDVAERIRHLQAAGKRVIVLRDTPEMNATPPQQGGSAADCLSHASSPSECSLPREAAAFPDPMAAGAVATGSDIVDLDSMLCTDQRCLSQIGGVVVYTDDNHLTRTFARSLVPYLRDTLGPLL